MAVRTKWEPSLATLFLHHLEQEYLESVVHKPALLITLVQHYVGLPQKQNGCLIESSMLLMLVFLPKRGLQHL